MPAAPTPVAPPPGASASTSETGAAASDKVVR
jgi:hypothetical protein